MCGDEIVAYLRSTTRRRATTPSCPRCARWSGLLDPQSSASMMSAAVTGRTGRRGQGPRTRSFQGDDVDPRGRARRRRIPPSAADAGPGRVTPGDLGCCAASSSSRSASSARRSAGTRCCRRSTKPEADPDRRECDRGRVDQRAAGRRASSEMRCASWMSNDVIPPTSWVIRSTVTDAYEFVQSLVMVHRLTVATGPMNPKARGSRRSAAPVAAVRRQPSSRTSDQRRSRSPRRSGVAVAP